MGDFAKLYGKSPSPLKYSSADTRISSLQDFMGGAELPEDYDGMQALPIDAPEDLEAKFKSGVNRSDCPRMWGFPNPVKPLGVKRFQLRDAVAGWVRHNGEPVI